VIIRAAKIKPIIGDLAWPLGGLMRQPAEVLGGTDYVRGDFAAALENLPRQKSMEAVNVRKAAIERFQKYMSIQEVAIPVRAYVFPARSSLSRKLLDPSCRCGY
jgi:hypothetical protein